MREGARKEKEGRGQLSPAPIRVQGRPGGCSPIVGAGQRSRRGRGSGLRAEFEVGNTEPPSCGRLRNGCAGGIAGVEGGCSVGMPPGPRSSFYESGRAQTSRAARPASRGGSG